MDSYFDIFHALVAPLALAPDRTQDLPPYWEICRKIVIMSIDLGAWTCTVDKATPATYFCLCPPQELFLCDTHLKLHLQNHKDIFHPLLPIKAYGIHKSPGYIERFKARFEAKETGKATLRQKLAAFDQFINDTSEKISAMIRELTEHSNSRMSELRSLRTTLQTQIEEGVIEAESSLFDENPQLRTAIAAALRDSSRTDSIFTSLQTNVPQGTSGINLRDWLKPLKIKKTEVKVYDIDSRQWRRLFPLQEKIKVTSKSGSAVFDGNKIFVCGGLRLKTNQICIYHIVASAYVLEPGGFVNHLKPLHTRRYSPGIIYDPGTDSIYVFGGGDGEKPIKSSEQLVLQSTYSWYSMPDMLEPRSSFTPCLHAAIVYLCGGWADSIETYDPETQTYTKIYNLPMTLDSCISVVDEEDLVIIGMFDMCRWNLRRRKIISHQGHPQINYCWSSCTPVVSAGAVYTVWKDVCHVLDLKTGVDKA